MIAKPVLLSFPVVASLAVCLTASEAAKADTIYDFNALVSTGVNGPIAPMAFQLTLADGFVPESISRDCYPNGCVSSGNFTDFSLTFSVGGELLGVLNDTPDTQFEHTAGTINGADGNLVWNTSMNTVSLDFANGLWNATLFSGNPALEEACGSTGCIASGTVAEVPEPATFGIFAAGLLGIALAWRFRHTRIGRAAPHLA